jgi:hypothetical protein
MPLDPRSNEYSQSPAFALVIGISKYKYAPKPEQKPGDDEFSNLRLAAKDALDVAEFLKDNGGITYDVVPLIDVDASLENIKYQLDILRARCRAASETGKVPLVLIYFAGHGLADDAGRHYLVPHDAKRSRLFATALSNKFFNECLNDLKTERLVVFIDACHAGAMGVEGSRGDNAGYNMQEGLGEGAGRFLIASCKPSQQSYEQDANGIFTGHLLSLLKCESDDFDDEAVDIVKLFPLLKRRVQKTAFEHFGKEQEPTQTSQGATELVLAINNRARQRNIRKKQDAINRKQAFL